MPVGCAVASPRRAEMALDSQNRARLNVAVVRLLGLALDISEGWSSAPSAATLSIPFGYRDWPHLTSSVDARTGTQRLRFYVCPKALLTPDSESFPVGTTFVVESEPGRPRARSSGARPSVFAMEKCAGLTVPGVGSRHIESWIYASWDSDARRATTDLGRCGVCRLPWLTPPVSR
ncbi:MAG: hypothetical protein R3B37_10635 [Nitrospira sp.]|nr:hypothetical protein [Nitrospira sp.]